MHQPKHRCTIDSISSQLDSSTAVIFVLACCGVSLGPFQKAYIGRLSRLSRSDIGGCLAAPTGSRVFARDIKRGLTMFNGVLFGVTTTFDATHI